MSENLFKIQPYIRPHIGVDPLVTVGHISVSEINFFVSEIVNHRLKISRVESRKNVAYGDLSCDISIVFSNHLVKPLVERWAQPIHSEIDCVFDRLMPVSLRKRIFIVDNIAD